MKTLKVILYRFVLGNTAQRIENDQFRRVLSRLEYYYCEANCVISNTLSPSKLNSILKKINSYLSYAKKLVIVYLSNTEEESVKTELKLALKEQHVKKSEFDNLAKEFLESCEVSSSDISSMLSAPRTLRSQSSFTITTTSSSKMSQAIVNEQKALLKVKHLEEQLKLDCEESALKFQRDLEEYERKRNLESQEAERKRNLELEEAEFRRKRELEEAELKHKRDRLKAIQELNEASLER